jgi:hypothetical protein
MRMKTWVAAAGVGLALGASFQVAAQLGDCAMVYIGATQNVTNEERQASFLNVSYNLYCERNGEVRSSTYALDLQAIVKAIPLSFSAAATDDRAKIQEFCKVGWSNNAFSERLSSSARIVAVDALKSFNECRALEIKSLKISMVQSHPEFLTISGTITNPDLNPSVDGIQYNRDLVTCESTSFSNGRKEVLDPARNVRRRFRGSFSIQCARKPQKQASLTFYPRATVSLATSQGPYSVVLAEDQMYGFVLASQSKAQYNRVEAERDTARNERDNARAEAANLTSRLQAAGVSKIVKYTTGERHEEIEAVWGKRVTDGRDGANYWAIVNEYGRASCAPDQAFVYQVRNYPGNCCGYSWFIAVCVKK